MSSEEEEISFKEMVKNLMTDDTFNDVSLKGSDGTIISANRAALGARSVVFRKMLFGEFEEASNNVVPIGFHSSVLQSLVEYIHTDTAAILQKSDESNYLSQETIQTVISLIEGAMYFQFPGLSRKAKEFLLEALETSPSLSFRVLKACEDHGPSVPGDIKADAMEIIRANTNDVLSCGEVEVLSASLLEEILQDDKPSNVTEFQRFQLLQLWASFSNERHEAASKLTKHIRLDCIDPEILSSVVEPSGLVAQGQLLETYKKQAMKAKEFNVTFNSPRELPTWKKGPGGKQLLDLPPLVSGVIRWTVQVEECGHFLWLGVAAMGGSRTAYVFTANQNENYVRLFVEGGFQSFSDDLLGLRFKHGSKITLELNLRPNDDHYGKLSASVDGGAKATIFSSLHERLPACGGYVPTLLIEEPAKVRLLSFKKVDCTSSSANGG